MKRSSPTHFPALWALPLLGLVGAGCSNDEGITEPFLLAEEAAVVMADSLLVLEEGEVGWRGDIGFTFRNDTGRLVSLLNCHGGYALLLEKWEAAAWVPAWSPALLSCLSPPIEIPSGESLPQVLKVFGGHPDANHFPRFSVDEIEGIYRLVILAAYWEYEHPGPPWGLQLPEEHRISHPFEIRIVP